MADEIALVGGDAAAIVAPVEAPAPVPEVVATPVVEAPSAIEAAVVAPVEAAPVVEAPTEPAPAEAAPLTADAPKPEDAAPEPVAPVYTDFTLPETLKADPEQMTAFTGVLGKYGLTQEAGQELIDLHTATIQKMADTMAQQQQDVFAETRRGWVQEFDKQAGNRRDTVLNDAKWAITELVPDEKARKTLWDALAITGAGDHPAVITAFASAAARMRERNAPPRPLPAKTAPANPADRRYGQPRR